MAITVMGTDKCHAGWKEFWRWVLTHLIPHVCMRKRQEVKTSPEVCSWDDRAMLSPEIGNAEKWEWERKE